MSPIVSDRRRLQQTARGPRRTTTAQLARRGGAFLLLVIAVFAYAYNANNGLPLLPSYTIYADLPYGSNLARNNEVREGGSRIGVVTDVSPITERINGHIRTVARLQLKLQASLPHLPINSQVRVRELSSLGLKYVQIIRGHASHLVPDGGVLALDDARVPIEFDTVVAINNARTRRATDAGLVGLGDSVTGRGGAMNDAIGGFKALLPPLTQVLRGLAQPSTRLSDFYPSQARYFDQLAPVARQQGQLYQGLDATLNAQNRAGAALSQGVKDTDRSERLSLSSFAQQAPFLRDFAAASRRLVPGLRELTAALPTLNTMLKAGIAAGPSTDRLDRLTQANFAALGRFGQDHRTLPGLHQLTLATDLSNNLFQYLAPYQTVCNYGVLTFTDEAEDLGQQVNGGTAQLFLQMMTDGTGTNRVDSMTATKPADVPPGTNPKTATDAGGQPYSVLHEQYGGPAIDANGNANCQAGQFGYPYGPLSAGNRYAGQLGGSHVVTDSRTPGDRGPTYGGVPSLSSLR